METILKVTGMTCGMCVQHVTKALQNVAGVQSAAVDLSSGQAIVKHQNADAQALVEAVTDAGYKAQEMANGA